MSCWTDWYLKAWVDGWLVGWMARQQMVSDGDLNGFFEPSGHLFRAFLFINLRVINVYTCICVSVWSYVHMFRDQGRIWVSSSAALHTIPFKGLSLNLEITIPGSAYGQWDPGIFTSPYLSAGVTGTCNHAVSMRARIRTGVVMFVQQVLLSSELFPEPPLTFLIFFSSLFPVLQRSIRHLWILWTKDCQHADILLWGPPCVLHYSKFSRWHIQSVCPSAAPGTPGSSH